MVKVEKNAQYPGPPPERRKAMPVPKANQRAVNKYVKNNYDRINVTMPKGKKDTIQAHAEARGESVNGFINRAIDHQISYDRDKGPSEALQGPLGAGVVSLHSEAYACAVAASTASDEDLTDFVSRAVETQAQRDATARKLGSGK